MNKPQLNDSRRLSVLMSVYHGELPENLEECFASLLVQSRPADEVVLVIDGMIGRELTSVVDRFKSSLPLKIKQLPDNQGLGLALNIGIKKCTHEFVARMDSDDICHPDRFRRQMQYLENNADVDVLGSAVQEFRRNSGGEELTNMKSVPEGNDEINRFLVFRNAFNHPTVMFRKSSILKAGSYQHCLFFEDFYLWLRLRGMRATFANVPEPLVRMRVGVDHMARRRGLNYSIRESQFFLLTLRERLLPAWVFVVWIPRICSRLLPIQITSLIYRFLRS